jgi:hypothetical protein
MGGAGLALTTFLFGFCTTGWGAGSATATAAGSGSGAGSGATSGAAGASTGAATSTGATASTGAGAATGDSFGFDAQPDKVRAERSKTAGTTKLSVLGMEFSRNTVGDMLSGRNLPTDILVPQTINPIKTVIHEKH